MNVTSVTANIKYSAEAKGAWRTIELGAEATIAPNEDWHTAQEQLYHQLGQQMRGLWANGNGKPAQEPPTPETPAPKSNHWCEAHQMEFKKRNGKHGVFYSHKAPDGSWCNER
jgi:hypothetical protein